tara:strand:- start:158 stop:601 length:444 start_codon:yes stop_codon:yes gene_type:complete
MHIAKTANHINNLVNHPDIRPTAGGDGVSRVDFSPVFNQIVALEDKGGAWLFMDEGDDIYEGHYMFLKKYRGKKALEFGREALDYMFNELGAKRIIGRQPVENKLASVYNTALGIKKGPEEEVSVEGFTYMAQIFTIDREDFSCHQQ